MKKVLIGLIVLYLLSNLGILSSIWKGFSVTEDTKQRMPFMAGLLDRDATTGQKDLQRLFGIAP